MFEVSCSKSERSPYNAVPAIGVPCPCLSVSAFPHSGFTESIFPSGKKSCKRGCPRLTPVSIMQIITESSVVLLTVRFFRSSIQSLASSLLRPVKKSAASLGFLNSANLSVYKIVVDNSLAVHFTKRTMCSGKSNLRSAAKMKLSVSIFITSSSSRASF